MKSAFVSATTAAALLSTAHGADLANGAYDNADACAEKILQGSPTLPKDWVQDGVNNLVGGRENGVWVGFVSGAGTLIPDISMMDGPQGVRNIFSGVEFPTRTSWASAASVGQGWSPEIAYYVGKYQAQETKITGANMALSPGVEIHRVPTNGRNWEYVAGEDATLGVLGRDVTRGLHSEKVLTSIKHYVTQTQELARTRYVAIIDEATLMETYIRPFIPSIQEGTSAVMCAYSKIQVKEHPETSAWLCGSEHVTNGLLRNVLGFKGAVLTDWSAEAKTATNGVETVNRMAFDWEMKWGSNPDKPVPNGDAAAQRQITKNTLVAMLASGVMEKPAVCSAEPASPVYTPALDDVPEAYKEAFKSTAGTATVQVAESMVLLKNEGVLPLPVKPTKVLLMGEALLTGGGSGDSAAFAYQFPDKKGEATANNGGPFAQARMKEKVTDALGAGAVVHWNFEASKLALDEYDVIISFASNYRSEAYLVGDKDGYYELDRCNSEQDPYTSFTYGTCVYKDEIATLQAARTAGTKVISVTTVGGAFSAFDYIDDVDAAITMYYPGQYLADALSLVLVGKYSPGGKLISTLPDLEADGKHIQSPIARFNEGLDITAVGGSTDDDECTPFDSDPWNTGVAIPCCEGTNACVFNWNGGDNWFFICTKEGAANCPGEIKPQGHPVTPIDQCTPADQDPWSNGGAHPRACCPGTDACVHNWNGDNNYFFICTLSNTGAGACPGEIIPQGRVAKGGGVRKGLKQPAVEWDEGANAPGTTVQYGAESSEYSEQNLVGYKYFEKYNMKPLFPFGFGLSYQSPTLDVNFGNSCTPAGCSIAVTVAGLTSNADQVASEVIQVYVGYVSDDASKDTKRPVKELRAFKKVWNSGSVTIPLDSTAFETSWDVTKQAFVTPCVKDGSGGSFIVYVGTSSDKIKASTTFSCGGDTTPKSLPPTSGGTASPTTTGETASPTTGTAAPNTGTPQPTTTTPQPTSRTTWPISRTERPTATSSDDENNSAPGGEVENNYGATMAYAVSAGVVGFVGFALVYNRYAQKQLDAKVAAQQEAMVMHEKRLTGGPVTPGFEIDI